MKTCVLKRFICGFVGIAVYFLVTLMPSLSHGQSVCSDLFPLVRGTQKSFIYDPKWLVDQVRNKNLVAQIRNSDLESGHIEALSQILEGALPEFRDNILRESGGISFDITRNRSPFNKALLALGVNLKPDFNLSMTQLANLGRRADVPENRLQGFLERVETYLFLEPLIKAQIAEKKVSYLFYQTVTEMMYKAFTIRKRYTGMVTTIFHDGGPAQAFAKYFAGQKRSVDLKYLRLNVTMKVNYYDFFELWPDVFPKGVEFSTRVRYDGGIGDAQVYADHDEADHNVRFLEAFDRLGPKQTYFLQIIQFLRDIRPQLTPHQIQVIGRTIGVIPHDTFRLDTMIEMFTLRFFPRVDPTDQFLVDQMLEASARFITADFGAEKTFPAGHPYAILRDGGEPALRLFLEVLHFLRAQFFQLHPEYVQQAG